MKCLFELPNLRVPHFNSQQEDIDEFLKYVDNNEHSFRNAACMTKSQIDQMRFLEQSREALAALKENTYRTLSDFNVSVYAKPKVKDLRIDAQTLEQISKLTCIYTKLT